MTDRKDFNRFIMTLISDALAIEFSWLAAYFIRFHVIPGGEQEMMPFFLRISLVIIPLYIYFLRRNNLYSGTRNDSWIQETQFILYSTIIASTVLILIFYFFFPDRISRLTLLLFMGLCVVSLFITRMVINKFFRSISRRSKSHVKHVLFVGYGPFLERFYSRLQENFSHHYHFIGHIESENRPLDGLDIIEGKLSEYLEDHNPDTIVISYPPSKYRQAQNKLQVASESLSQVIFIPALGLSYLGTRISDFYNLPLVYVNHVSFSHIDRILKRLFDIVCSFLGLVVLSPLLLVIGILVKLTSKGPVFFKQNRITLDEKEFAMIKFRSMRDVPESQKLQWTTENDPRVTKFGTFIRKTSIDELPQLWNVLKGDMSLIGPRPERKEFVQQFNKEIPGYCLRHKMKAGLSGWAQVNGLRGDTSITDRVESDLFYIRNWSIIFDIKIVILTFVKGFVNKNAY